MFRRSAFDTALIRIAAQFDHGPVGLNEPPIIDALDPLDGFERARPGVVSGALLRRLLVGLEAKLKGQATTLAFAGVTIEGPLLLNDLMFDRSLDFDTCVFNGAVEARNLACRTLTLDGSTLQSSFDGRVMTIRGNLFLRRLTADQPFLLRDTVVDGVIDCCRSRFRLSPSVTPPVVGMAVEDHRGEAFGASRVRARSLFWKEVAIGDGLVTLVEAEIQSLRDDLGTAGLASWPSAGALGLRGFTYVRKAAAPLPTHRAWLDLDPDHFEENGLLLATALERAGAQDDADRLALAVRWRANARLGRASLLRWARLPYLILQHAAFHPGIVLAVLLALLGATTWGTGRLARSGAIAPIDLGVLRDPCFLDRAAKCTAAGWAPVAGHPYALPRAFARFEPLDFSLGLLFPYAPSAKTDLWGASTTGTSLLLLALRTIGLGLQASVLWSVVGKRQR